MPGKEQTQKKTLDEVRDLMRVQFYWIRTERAYVAWMHRFILFHALKTRP